MRATVFHGPFDVRVERVPDAAQQEPTDAVVRIIHACTSRLSFVETLHGSKDACRPPGKHQFDKKGGGERNARSPPLSHQCQMEV